MSDHRPEPTSPGAPEAEVGMGEHVSEKKSEPVEPRPTSGPRKVAARALERAAESARTLSGRTEARRDMARHAAPVARTAAGALQSAATYTRARELPEMRDDLESAIRRHPVRAIAIAFVAGYLTRRLL